MKFLLKRKRLFYLLVVAFCFLSGGRQYSSSSVFYLGTDKSFQVDENPYVNLEGSGYNEYHVRVYRVKDPDAFLVKKIEDRLVKEKSSDAFANPLALFKTSWNYFREDFRDVARNELNIKTRAHIRTATGFDLQGSSRVKTLAQPGLLKEHAFVASFKIPQANQSWVYKKIPVPIKDSGFYLVEIVSSSHVAYTVVVKSNVSFVIKQSDGQTTVFAADKITGKPAAGAELSLYDTETGEVVGRGSTGKNGVFSVREKTPSHTLVLLKHEGDFAVSDPDFYAKSFYGKGGIRSYLYTDRPIYKPGNEVNFKGIVRHFDGKEYVPVSGRGSVDVITKNGKVVLQDIPVILSKEMGTFSGKFNLPSSENTFLGTYHLVLKYGKNTYSTEFQVEAYKKPSFLVKVKTAKKKYVQNEKVKVTISANYYYGAPVADARVHYRVFRKPRYSFSPVGTLAFMEQARSYLGMAPPQKSELILDKQESLDSDGNFTFSFQPESYDEDSVYSIMARVSDDKETLSGAASVAVNRGAFFIQVRSESRVFDPGDKVKISAALVPFDKSLDSAGLSKLIEGRQVKLNLYTRGFEGISREKSRKKVLTLSEKSDANGDADFKFKLPGKGHYIVEFSASDPQGEKIKATTTFWASAKTDSIQTSFNNLTLTSSKDIYQIGDMAEVMIVSPVSGGYLFITEEANKVLRYQTVELKGNVYKYKTKIKSHMSPNFTVAVTQFSGNEVYKSEIKIVAPPRDKMISVKVAQDKKEYSPGEMVTLHLQTDNYKKDGIPAEVSVSVVDEAIYQLQADKNPVLLSYFYHPRRNNVQTTLSTSFRFFGYSEENRLKLAMTSDPETGMAAIKDKAIEERENFKDTAFWSAHVKTDSSGKATVQFQLPANLTTWRITAVAVSRGTAVGQKRTSFISKKDIMLLATPPSYLIRGQEQVVAASVVNMTKKKFTGKLSLDITNGKVVRSDDLSVSLKPNERKTLFFTVRPSETKEEQVKLTYGIKGEIPGKTLGDQVSHRVPLRYYGLERSESVAFSLPAGKSSKAAEFEMKKSYQGPVLELWLSPGYGEALRSSLAYLAGYPYGCVEQTMSRFMPLLAAAKTGFITPSLKKELPAMVKKGLLLLASHQNPDGSFGWFQGNSGDPLMSAYVHRGLVVSKKLGIQVDPAMINRSNRYLYRFLARGKHNTFLKAYILFALSEGATVKRSLVNNLAAEAKRSSTYTKALTALVLHNQGEKKKAKEMLEEALKESGVMKYGRLRFASQKEEVIQFDQIETVATLLVGAVRMNSSEETLEILSRWLLEKRQGSAWKNSRDTGVAVLALSERVENIRDTSKPSDIVVIVNGKRVKSFRASVKQIHEGDARIEIGALRLRPGSNRVRIKKTAGTGLFVVGSLRFFDRSESFSAQSNGFQIKRTYYKVAAKRDDGRLRLSASKTNKFDPGDLVMVKLDVEAMGEPASYLQIEDPVLPGFSVVRNDAEYYSSGFALEYNSRQIFDHKAVFFAGGPRKKITIRYFLNADLPGDYAVIPASAKLMYYPGVFGSTSDARLVVKELQK